MTQNKKAITEQDIEKWLEINTFVCPHGLGRLSPEQCEANRKRAEGKEAWLFKLPPRPKQCEKCTEWKHLIEEVKRRRRAMSSKKVGICINCKEEKPIHARGLCARCYYHLKKEGTLPEPKISKRSKSNNSKRLLRVTVNFAQHKNLYDFLEEKARKELRSFSAQIIWELRKALSKELED